MPLLHKATIALFSTFVVVWSYLSFVPEPILNKHALDPEAKAFVTGSLKEFCTSLYTDAVCPKVSIAGKQRWVASTYLGGSDIPTQQTDAILLGHGWQKMPVENERSAIFCKQGYAARYDHTAGQVGTLYFTGGSRICEKLTQTLAPRTIAWRTCKVAKISL